MSTPKSINNAADERLNARSPYYIEADRPLPAVVVIPDPIENNTPPVVVITASDTNPTVGDTVILTANATDSDGTIVAYQWGDGETTVEISVTSEQALSIEYFVTVTDDDGDTGSDSIIINWQLPVVEEDPETTVGCGDGHFEGKFVGTREYKIEVGDKIGNITIELVDQSSFKFNEVPVKFDLSYGGATATTGYVGSTGFINDASIIEGGGVDNTATASTKGTPTTLTINKTTASPTFATLTAKVLTLNEQNGSTAFRNDSFGFRVVCPDVTTPETKFHTLIGDCGEGQTSTITYLDVDGVLNTVTLDFEEVRIVSARPNSIIETVCNTTIEVGGDSFDKGNPEQDVDPNVQFVFWIDKSGSLEKEGQAIEEMTKNQLRDSFLNFYENDNEIYESRVKTTIRQDEKFLSWAATPKSAYAGATKIVNCIYIDEAAGTREAQFEVYHHIPLTAVWGAPFTGDNTRTATYNNDLAALRSVLDSQNEFGDHLVLVFCIEKDRTVVFENFSWFVDNVTTGRNGFEGSKGLSDRSEVKFIRNVEPERDASYYHTITINALKEIGFNI